MAGEGEPRKVSTCLVLRTSPAAVHRLAAAADVPCGPKKIARKKERAGRRTTRIMNTYACRGGTSFTARHDREEIGPVKEDTPRDTIRARAPASPAEQMFPPLRRNGDHCPFFFYFFFFFSFASSSAVPTPCVRTFPRPHLLARRLASPNLALSSYHATVLLSEAPR